MDILLVEDNPGDARLIQEMLKEGRLAGSEVDVVERLDAALRRAGERRFGAIILDLNLPDSTGLDTLDRIVAATGGMIPVIILTGLNDEVMGESSINRGADDYLVKGDVTLSQLARSLRYAVERKRMARELAEREERYRALVEHQGDAVCRWLPDTTLTYVNGAYCALTGVSREHAAGRRWIDFVPAEDREAVLSFYCDLPDGLDVYTFEHRVMTPSGVNRWIFWSDVPIRSVNGNIVEFQSVGRDITERKEAEDLLTSNFTLLRIAGETAKFGGWRVDIASGIIFWSDEVAAIHEMPSGYCPSVNEGIDFYAPEWRDMITRIFTDCAVKGIPYDEEMEIITAKGNRVWVRTIGEAVRDTNGKIIQVQGSFQDITERKRIEEKTMAQLEELRRWHEAMLDREERVIELKREVNDLLKRLGEPARYRSVEE
ncbi:MAG TPA: PAS domain S-box protein [Spirochaetota bacterium]|nr:PAS domain S-box protein [Spirochaetota bacterium]HPU88682.1 PAS domain S-box protein [Spirochaetota bacterium]